MSWRARIDANRLARAWAALGGGLAVSTALTFDLRPTGLAWWDPFLTAAFVIVVILGAASAPRGRLLPGLVLCGGLSASPALGAFSILAAFWVASTAARPDRRAPGDPTWMLESGGLGVVMATTLLQLEAVGPFGTQSALAAVALVPLALPLFTPPARRWTMVGLAVTSMAVALGAVAALRAGRSLESAATLLDTSSLDPADVRAVEVAGSELRNAQASVRHWSAAPARLVPIMSQNLQVIDTLATAGVAASDAGVELVALADQLTGSDEPVDEDADDRPSASGIDDPSSIDLDTLAFAREPLAEASVVLHDTSRELDGPARQWLVPRASTQVDRAADTIDVLTERVDLASRLANGLPNLLGRDEPQAYLVLVTNPAEARRGGGIVGAFVDVTIDDGHLEVARVGRETELNWSGGGSVLSTDDYPGSFLAGSPHRFAQNWTETTDPSVTAQAAMELYPQMGGREIDGVVLIDPIALAAMLELTGPVEFSSPDGRAFEVDADSLPDFLFQRQYALFPDNVERSRVLGSIVAALFESLDGAGPTIDQIGQTLGPVVRAGRLNVIVPEEHGSDPLIDGLGFRTAERTTSDHLGVVHTNATGNKLDAHLTRSVEYRVDLDEDGTLAAEVRVTLTNTAEPDSLPDVVAGRPERTGVDRGTNRMLLSVLTPHRIESVGRESVGRESVGRESVGRESVGRESVGRESADQEALVEIESIPVSLSDEVGFTGGTVEVSVAPGETVVIVFTLDGELDPGHAYGVRVDAQPLVVPDRLTVSVNGRTFADDVELRRDTDFGIID